MEEKGKETYIDLVKVLQVIWKNIIWILIATVVCAVLAYVITYITWDPTYTSEVQVYAIISAEGEDTQSAVTTSQITMRRNITALYNKAISKPDSLKELSELLKGEGYEVSSVQLGRYITAKADSDAEEIIHVKVVTGDPDLSYTIAKLVGEQAPGLVKNAYVGCSLAIFNNATYPTHPNSSNALRNTAIGGLIGLIVSAGIFILIYMLDKTVKSAEELESDSGVRHLGEIPDIHDTKGGGGYYKYYEYGSPGSRRSSGKNKKQ